MKFKTIAGDADRASGILFNVKPNGDWLAVRYNDTENNVALWEFHNGMRRNMRFSDRAHKFMLDRAAWHELKLTIDGADLKAWLDGELALEYTLGSEPGPGRNNAPPNPDLIPGQQRRAAPAGDGQGRPLGEDRHDQLLQRLRGEPEVMNRLVQSGRMSMRLIVRCVLAVLRSAPAVAAFAQSPEHLDDRRPRHRPVGRGGQRREGDGRSTTRPAPCAMRCPAATAAPRLRRCR